jgi:hypothetical protein
VVIQFEACPFDVLAFLSLLYVQNRIFLIGVRRERKQNFMPNLIQIFEFFQT